MSSVEEIRTWLDSWAPQQLAEEWDNVGTLVDCGGPVDRVLTALDITRGVVEEAEQKNCRLIIAHHPVIFSPLKKLGPDQPTFRLVQKGISAICMHTNLDAAQGGVNDVLAGLFGLQGVCPVAGMGRVGRLPRPLAAAQLAGLCARLLGTPVRFVDAGRPVAALAVVGGAGGDFLAAARAAGADALLTGEAKHHEALDAAETGISLVTAGHFATEAPVVPALAEKLRGHFPALEVLVSESCRDPFVFCSAQGKQIFTAVPGEKGPA